MLGDYPVDVVLLATDLRASRSFYADRLGLEIDREDAGAVRFNCGGGSQISLSASTADTQTQASWRVGDLGAELARLRSRGVEILEYDTPGLKTENGVADVGFARAAWFTDPGGNVLSIIQYK
jgi:catechol 2,3-dioxygenase-like lactoylglutathione lyase family enzyme